MPEYLMQKCGNCMLTSAVVLNFSGTTFLLAENCELFSHLLNSPAYFALNFASLHPVFARNIIYTVIKD
jgi:hypothetical protein